MKTSIDVSFAKRWKYTPILILSGREGVVFRGKSIDRQMTERKPEIVFELPFGILIAPMDRVIRSDMDHINRTITIALQEN